MMSRPITATIHHQALRHNLAIARKMMPNSQVFAVVKANAYGHGIERVFEAFQSADGFALLDIAEAKRLRQLGWKGKILLLEGIFSLRDLYDCAELKLDFTVHSPHQLQWLQSFSETQTDHSDDSVQFDIYLKLNSGMNRLGFKPVAYRQAWQELQRLSVVNSITHMTHFSDADGERLGEQGVLYQQKIFDQITAGLPGLRSISNSAAILRYATELESDVVRSGIMLYGSSPDYPKHTIQNWQLEPTMSLRSEIIAIQDLESQDSVGYGSTYFAENSLRIGIVACGYADGYQRLFATGTPILVDGIRTQTIGRVSMDMLAVDLSDIPNAQVGSEVVLWGRSTSGAVLAIDDVAQSSGTVGYELMCAVTNRVNFQIEITNE